MLKKLYDMFYGREYKLRERVFRMVVLIGAIALIIGVIEALFVNNTSEILVPLILLMGVFVTVLIMTFKYRKVDLAAMIVAIVIIVIVFPEMFLLGGGLESGSTLWFALGILYIFTMFYGKRMVFFLILAIVVDAGTYLYAYYHPEYIVSMDSMAAAYADSFFSVMAVGLCGGAIIKSQMNMFKQERIVARQQQEELEKISKANNSFFASMSHEIRTPINTIVGLNEMILRESGETDIKEYALSIQSASKMLLNLINDILDLSQLEMKKMEILPAEYKTVELFRNLIDMIRVRIAEKKLEFIIDIDENLPSALSGDVKRLIQVALNLLTNAVKYTNEGSVTLAVGTEVYEGGLIGLKISVSDTGIGIRKEDLEHIYDSFKRADEHKNIKIEGSGLGLSITKQLVDMMDGEIMVDSIYTKGSVFTIVIPQVVVDPTPIGKVRFLTHNAALLEEYKPKFMAPEARILIVDDNHMNSLVESKLLKETKVRVDIANSGEECLEMTKKKYYNVILMDYMMPVMNGVETLKRLRRQENSLCRDSAVIALSANTASESGGKYLDEGFNGYLEKPIRGELLETEILKFIPSDIVEYRTENEDEVIMEGGARQVRLNKKKRIRITTDCVSDLPDYYIEKYDIGMMYLYIKTEKGRFADTVEISSDNLIRYMTATTSSAVADKLSVEECEEFFSSNLTQAEEVIHISMARNVGDSFEVEKTAAKGFDHVHILDSGQISCGQALTVLYAAKLAMDGYSVTDIYEKVAMIKEHIRFRFILPSAQIFYDHGYIDKFHAKIFILLGLHPVLKIYKSKNKVIGFRCGRLENAWKRFIRSNLRHKSKINTEIVFISHAGCSVEQQELIRREILRCVPFKQVIMQRTSVSVACTSGIGSFAFAYYTNIEEESDENN